MGQEYLATNLSKYQTGRQTDVMIANAALATSATAAYSLNQWEFQEEPELIKINDAEGNRSTNTLIIEGHKKFPFKFGGHCEVDKLDEWIYLATGKRSAVQDGVTGAYEVTYTMLNNVVLPQFTAFYAIDGDSKNNEVGYKRAAGCVVNRLKINVSGEEAMFEGDGFASTIDGTLNSTTNVGTLTITSFVYQSDGSILVTFSGAPTLSSVKTGDVLNVGATGVTNVENRGQYIIISADNTAKTVKIINPQRSDAVKDETSLTASGNSITIITAPTYPTITGMLVARHKAVREATNEAGLAAATFDGLGEFEFEIVNNVEPIFEGPKSQFASAMLAKNIEVNAKFDQLIKASRGHKARTYQEGTGTERAWEFQLEDTAKKIGTSTTYSPLLRLIMPNALGITSYVGMHSDDHMQYDWTLNTSKQQSTKIILRNAKATPV